MKKQKSLLFALILSILMVAILPNLSWKNVGLSSADTEVYGFDLTEKELYLAAKQMAEESKDWTIESCPQSVDDLPLFPSIIHALFVTLSKTDYSFYEADDSLILNTDVWATLATIPALNGTASCCYDKDGNRLYVSEDLQYLSDGEYELPKGASMDNLLSLSSYFTSFYESIGWTYGVSSQITSLYLSIVDTVDYEFSIHYLRGINELTGQDYLSVEVMSGKTEKQISYDAYSGELITLNTYNL